MRFSERWLRTLVDPPLATEALAEKLTMAGLEVEELDPLAPPFSRVVVGRIEAIAAHPNADRLRVHGVKREVFLAPTATNSFEWLRGEQEELSFRTRPAQEIAEWWLGKWAVPRSERPGFEDAWRSFRRESWTLYQ